MNWVDFLIIGSMAWFTFAAFRAGLIREVVTMAGAIAGVLLAGHFYMRLAEDLDVAIDNTQAAQVSAFIIIFGATVLGSQMIALFLKRAVTLLMLGPADAFGGAVLGLLKGFVFVEIGLIAAITFPSLGLQQAADQSKLAPFFLKVLPVLKLLLPAEFRRAIDSF